MRRAGSRAAQADSRWLVGIFVGGRARRFGGIPKGLLPAGDGEPIVSRLSRICRDALGDPAIRLVGHAEAYRQLGLEAIADAPAGIGPIGGLSALLKEARCRGCTALALAGDMPRLEAPLIGRLAAHAPEADAVAPRPEGIWQPLFARYEPEPCLEALERVLARQERALFTVLRELGPGAVALPIDARERGLLVDWDSPDDLG